MVRHRLAVILALLLPGLAIAAPAWVNVGATFNNAAGGDVGLPASIAADDILVLVCYTSNQAISVSNGNGGTWTELPDSPQGTGTAASTTSTRLTAFWSRYNGTQTAPTISDSGDANICVIGALRGVVTSDPPYDVTSGGVDSVSDQNLSVTGDTTTADDTLVMVLATLMDDAQNFNATWTNGDLTGIAVRSNFSGIAGNDGRGAIVTGVKATAGSYGPTTNTLSASSVKAFMTIAWKAPAANTSASTDDQNADNSTTHPSSLSNVDWAADAVVLFVCHIHGSANGETVTMNDSLSAFTWNDLFDYDHTTSGTTVRHVGKWTTTAGAQSGIVLQCDTGSDARAIAVIEITGADTTTPFGTPASAQGSSATASVTLSSTTAGNLAIAVGGLWSSASASGSGNTLLYTITGSTGDGMGGVKQVITGTSTPIAIGWSTSSTWTITGVEVLPAGGEPPAATVRLRTLLGVGE